MQPFPPGGAVDTISRVVAERLSARLGQQVVVDNRPGANGAIALNIVAASPADGYTMMAVAQSFLTHQTIYRDFKHDVRKDLAPIIQGAIFPLVLVVHPAVPVRSVKELVERAKSQPGSMAYGDNGGIGSSGHIASEFLRQRAGIDVTHVLYKGAGPMYVDLMGGQIQMAFAHITSILPHVKAARLRPLASTSATRVPSMPDVPIMAESGFPGFTVSEVWGILGPAGLNDAIALRLNREIGEILKAGPLYERLTAEGGQVLAGPPREFASFIATEVPRIAGVLRQAGIKAGSF
ncbi:MAG: tripartite tricarboxylate transporter substrate binding protein [Burkholderiales bacterium]|nr:tripartite tricarboxylate transporter substrate binding protein [Burkholderiales bacterium]